MANSKQPSMGDDQFRYPPLVSSRHPDKPQAGTAWRNWLHSATSVSRRNLVLFSLVATLSLQGAAQDDAPNPNVRPAIRVAELRHQIALSQEAYVKALQPDVAPGVDAIAHLKNLRAALRQTVLFAAEQGNGSESILALNRSAIEALVETIHAYEDALVSPGHGRTTPWNVLTSAELTTLRAKAVANRAAVQRTWDALPAAERPASLLARKMEIESWIGGLEQEEALRGSVGTRGPPEIDPALSPQKLRVDFPDVATAERRMRTSFERRLAFQVEQRLAYSPADASLMALRDRIPVVKSPSVPPSLTRGPPTLESAAQDLNAAFQEETEAVILRDPVRQAKALAKAKTALQWLDAAQVSRDASTDWGASFVRGASLRQIRSDLRNWTFRLENQSVLGGDTKSEMRWALNRMQQIDEELDRRTVAWKSSDFLPPDDPVAGLRPLRGPPGGGGKPVALRTFEIAIDRNRLLNELSCLQKAADSLGPMSNASANIQSEIQKTLVALEEEKARLQQQARSAFERAELNVLESARGQQSALEATKLMGSKRVWDSGGDPSELLASIEKSPYSTTVNPTQPKSLRILTENDLFEVRPDHVPGMMSVSLRPASRLRPSGNPIAEFNALFPRTELQKDGWTRSFRGVMEDLQRAPGGVVIDARLPKSWVDRIKEVRASPATGEIAVQIDSDWYAVEPKTNAETVRLAYAFVRDGRVMPIDLRNLNLAESIWLTEEIASGVDLGRSDFDQIASGLRFLTAANIHPALRDTALGMQLIYIDQFIFDLLPDELDPSPLTGLETRFGFNVAQLRSLYLQDFHNLSNPQSWRALFQKSILSATSAGVQEDGRKLRVDVDLKFAIYRLPPSKSAGPAILLKGSTDWLQRNEKTLKQSSVLAPLVHFAAVTAVVRSALENGIKNNFSEFLEVPVPESPTPRLICRPEGQRGCALQVLSTSLER